MVGQRLWLASLGFALLIACGSDDSDSDGTGGTSGSSGSGGSGGAMASDCQDRCESKATECGAPASVATTECATLCAFDVTEAQAQCLESSACEVLEQAFAGGSYPCGIGPTGTGGTGGSSGTGGASGTGGGSSGGKTLGENCDCPDEGDWVTCSGTDSPCLLDLVCVEYGEEKKCTESCTPGGSCGGGLECTTLMPNGVGMGDYCW
jgi:hypothetical protein